MKFSRALSLFATLTLALTTLLVPTARPAAADEAPQETAAAPAISLDITRISPAVVEPGQDFTVTATITNNTDAPIADPRIALRIHRFRLGSATELQSWAEAPVSDSAGDVLSTEVFEEPLEPGQSRKFSITGLAQDLRLSGAADAWGPRGIALELTDAGRRVEIVRSFLLWQPTAELPVNRVAIVAPLTVSATEYNERAGRVSAISYDDDARLTQVLKASEASPAISWFVDPEVLAHAPLAWGEQFESLIPGRDILLLPKNDADFSALAHGNGQWLLDLIAAPADGQLLENGRTDVAWPNELSATTAQFLVDQGYRFAMVPPAQQSPALAGTLAHVATEAQDLTLVQPDLELQALLMSSGNSALNAQYLLAHSAIEAREQFALTTDSLVLLPRHWEPDPTDLAYKLSAISQAPWLQLSGVSTVLGGQGTSLSRLADLEPSAGALTPAELAELQELWTEFSQFAEVLPDPEAARSAFYPQLRSLSSVRLREDEQVRSSQLRRLQNSLRTQTGGLEIVPGSTMNLLAEAGSLPITVRNDLDSAAHAFLFLSTESRALEFPERVEVSIPAHSQVLVQVPVRAFASLDVEVRMELQNSAGDVVAPAQELAVRVRADWETAGTTVITVILATGLVAGIVRTIRRGKARTRQNTLEASSE